MLCVIPQIRKVPCDHSDGDHRKQFNSVIKKNYGLSDGGFPFTLEMFWTEYNDFNKNNGPFGGD